MQPVELVRPHGLVRADQQSDHVVSLPRRVGPLDLGEIADDLRDLL